MRRGLDLRYHQKFARPVAKGTGDRGHDPMIFGYKELFEWFDIPVVLATPNSLLPYVNMHLLPGEEADNKY
jgi:hypothetical protein